MFYFDPLYLIISLPALLIGILATIFLKLTYSHYSQKLNITKNNGLDTVTKIAERYNYNVNVEQGYAELSDNYNPMNRTVSLSREVASVPSIASVGVAAHEMGHVQQHQSGFFLIHIRTFLAPIISLGSNLGYIIFILGLALNFINLAWVGVILFSGTTVFALITLPIELDASRRAIGMIRELNLVDRSDITGVEMVLGAAALTYVAATFQSIGTLLYFILRLQGSSRRRS